MQPLWNQVATALVHRRFTQDKRLARRRNMLHHIRRIIYNKGCNYISFVIIDLQRNSQVIENKGHIKQTMVRRGRMNQKVQAARAGLPSPPTSPTFQPIYILVMLYC